jgi:methyl-accepting chemotaxis protein
MKNSHSEKKIFKSLRFTLTVYFIALSTLVLLIAGSLEIGFNTFVQRERAVEQQKIIAESAASQVKSFVTGKSLALVGTVKISNLASLDIESSRLALSSMMGFDSSFKQLILFDSQGKIITRVARTSEFSANKISQETIDDLMSYVRKGENYIGSVYVDSVTSEPMIIMAAPIIDIFGDLKGAFVAEVNLKFMWDLVAGIKVGETGLAYVVDEEGNLIAFKDVSRVLKGENLINLKSVNDFVNNAKESGNAGFQSVKGIAGDEAISSFVELGTPDWAVVVELPVKEAYKSLMLEVYVALATLVVNLLIIFIGSLFLSKKIIKPIRALKDATRRISQGDLGVKIETKSENEIGELASDFNEMVARLKELYDTLEKKVSERTAELVESKKELEKKIEEMERFNKLTIGREEKIIELKEEIRRLEDELEIASKNLVSNEKKQ